MIVLQQVRSPVPEDIKRLKLALAGFRSTKTRHDGARAARDLETSYASCSSHHLDDRARRSARSVLRAVLQDRTGQNRFGMVVPGVRWARTDMPTTTSHLGQGSNPVLWRRERDHQPVRRNALAQSKRATATDPRHPDPKGKRRTAPIWRTETQARPWLHATSGSPNWRGPRAACCSYDAVRDRLVRTLCRCPCAGAVAKARRLQQRGVEKRQLPAVPPGSCPLAFAKRPISQSLRRGARVPASPPTRSPREWPLAPATATSRVKPLRVSPSPTPQGVAVHGSARSNHSTSWRRDIHSLNRCPRTSGISFCSAARASASEVK